MARARSCCCAWATSARAWSRSARGCRREIDGRLGPEDRGGAGLQDAVEAVGDPRAQRVGDFEDEHGVAQLDGLHGREPDVEGLIPDGVPEFFANAAPGGVEMGVVSRRG